jgi:hypothetical protein
MADAQLRYHLHIPQPENLDNEEWAALMAELKHIRNKEAGR